MDRIAGLQDLQELAFGLAGCFFGQDLQDK